MLSEHEITAQNLQTTSLPIHSNSQITKVGFCKERGIIAFIENGKRMLCAFF
jgi:hypothetical protein